MAKKRQGRARPRVSARRKIASPRRATLKRASGKRARAKKRVLQVKRKSPQRKARGMAQRRAATPKKAKVLPDVPSGEQEIGHVSHYFSDISVGIIEVTNTPLQVGDKVRIRGQTTDFVQKISSMQFQHQPVEKAELGKSVGIKVEQRVREHDKVYKVA